MSKMQQLIARVRDDLNPEQERANFRELTREDFRAAFEEDAIGALRCYPFGCAQTRDDETVVTDAVFEFYRNAATQSPDHARVAMEVCAQHPTDYNSPRPNPHSDALMRAAAMKYPEVLLEHVQRLAGVAPGILEDVVKIMQRSGPEDTAITGPRQLDGASQRVMWPNVEDWVPSQPSQR